tara:strand:- start:58 stop:462 length:405 start_codon:yes stop_codon:yes gene_type:complete
MSRRVVGAMIAVWPVFGTAATLGEEDGMVINPLNGSDFEVVETRSMGAADFWCGAGTFVERRSGLSPRTLIYVKRPRGPSTTAPGRKAVVFSINPGGLDVTDMGLSLSVTVPGKMLRSVRARQFCRDAFTRSTK